MIPDNPRVGRILGEFVLDSHRYVVAGAELADRAYAFLNSVERGSVVAKAEQPLMPSPKIELADLWRANPREWRVDFEYRFLRVCRENLSLPDNEAAVEGNDRQ